MSSVEMGFYPFADSTQPMMDYSDIEERVDTSYGRVKVSIYGDRSKEAIVTFHDVGLDADNNFQNFFQFGTVVEITEKFCVYNINAPGQEMDASPLGENYSYPSMDGLAQIVDTVVRHFRLTSFIGFGVGAGANVMLRYAIKYQEKLRALVLINADCGTAGWLEWAYARGNISLLRSKGMNNLTVNHLMWHNFGKHEEQTDPEVIRQYRGFFLNHPNPGNLLLFMEAYLNRTEIVLQQPANGATSTLNTPILKVPILQLVGSRSAFLDETVNVNTKLDPANTEWVKVSNACGLVLDEKSEEVTESLLLFLQGLGYFAHLNVRKAVDRLVNSKKGNQSNSCAMETITEVDSSLMWVGDEDFCAHCGQILPIATKAPVTINCINCQVEWKVGECNKVINVREFSYEKKILETDEATGKSKEHEVQVDHACSKCSHNKATYSTQQTRSADEGQTVFYVCVNCGNRDIEYS